MKPNDSAPPATRSWRASLGADGRRVVTIPHSIGSAAGAQLAAAAIVAADAAAAPLIVD